jgi:hypothetical protein
MASAAIARRRRPPIEDGRREHGSDGAEECGEPDEPARDDRWAVMIGGTA